MNSSISYDASAVNPNDIKTLLANGLSTFLLKAIRFLVMILKVYLKMLLFFICPITCNWVFDNFILTEKLFAKTLRRFETCVLVNNNLCGKLFSSLKLPIFYEFFKATSVSIFIPDFNLLSCKLDNFTFKVLYSVILFWYYINIK